MTKNSCHLCPRNCGVNRLIGQKGFCGAGEKVEIYRFSPHFGEEPPITAQNGSGTIFFCRCTLKCIYCQNFPWSQEGMGSEYSTKELIDIFLSLYDKGCHNWNLISPTPWLEQIREALEYLNDEMGIKLPVVYNTSGYEKVEVLRKYANIADIYLSDLRYSSNETGYLGSGVKNYVDIARAALLEMWKMKGELKCNDDGVAISGVICRLLILPGYENEVIDNLRWLADNIGNKISISVMAQYTPAYKAKNNYPWNSFVSKDIYNRIVDEVDKLGFNNGWIQELKPSEDNLLGFKMNRNTLELE